MSYYLQVPVTKKLFRSPLRQDSKPTCSFYRDMKTKKLMFHDFGVGFTGTFIDVVKFKYNVSEEVAVKIIKNDFDIEVFTDLKKSDLKIINDNEEIAIKPQTKIQINIKPFTEKDLLWWKQFGISESTLKFFNVYRAETVFLNDFVCSSYSEFDPSYGYFFGFRDGLELWKIYYPARKKSRFLLNCNVVQGWDQLPETGNILVITKSLKDVMTLYELGIPALAPQAESIIMEESIMIELKIRFKNSVFNGDWDRAGKLFMIDNRKKHGGICMSIKDKSKFGKDISDFVKMHGLFLAKWFVLNTIKKCNI